MTGLEIAAILIGMVCGNLGAVVVKPFNLGLFWNSVLGAAGAASLSVVQRQLQIDLFASWSYDFLAAAGAGMVLMLICGGVVASFYRG